MLETKKFIKLNLVFGLPYARGIFAALTIMGCGPGSKDQQLPSPTFVTDDVHGSKIEEGIFVMPPPGRTYVLDEFRMKDEFKVCKSNEEVFVIPSPNPTYRPDDFYGSEIEEDIFVMPPPGRTCVQNEFCMKDEFQVCKSNEVVSVIELQSSNHIPNPFYLKDDVQYFPAGPEFKLPPIAAALKADRVEEKLRQADQDDL